MNANEVSDEMLMALADGELPEREAAALHARIARDPALAERFALFAETRILAAEALGPGPVPERLVEAIRAAPAGPSAGPDVVAFRPRSRWLGAAGMGLAASLVVAVGLGGFELGRRAGETAVAETGPLAAVVAVARVPTGGELELPGGGAARVLGSFETAAGFCRLISAEDATGAASRIVACRDDGAWQVVMSVADAGSGAFVTASQTAVEMVDDLLDRLGAGAPLDPDAEGGRLAE